MKMTVKQIDAGMERLQERLRFSKRKLKIFEYLLARQNICHQCDDSETDVAAMKNEILGE